VEVGGSGGRGEAAAGNQTLIRKWKEALEQPSAGHWTITAVRPVLQGWLDRKWGAVSSHLAQILTGHGCFGRYLWEIAGRENTPACHHCGGVEDTAQHTLEVCPAFSEERARLSVHVGPDVSLPAVIKSMVDSERSWQAAVSFCEEVMRQKETAERAREDDIAADQRRRKRPGRRRLAHDRRLPP
jgi:hypothetical protein